MLNLFGPLQKTNCSRIGLNILQVIWCKKKKPLQQELNNMDEQIKQIQVKPLDEQDHVAEASLMIRYEQIMMKLTDSYMQRAKKSG
jgi:hypothetical protein